MRRLLTAIAILLLASPLLAQTGANAGSTKAAQEFAKALTASTFFGVPRYTTVALPTCDAANTGAVAFNTTSTFLTFCNGTAWGDANSGAASAITPGSTTIGTATNCFAYADGSSVLQCDTSFVANNSGAGNGVFTVRKTMSGGAATNNFFRSAGTIPAGATTTALGSYFSYTTTGTSVQGHFGMEIDLLAGLASTATTEGLRVLNFVAGTSTSSYLTPGGNKGIHVQTVGAGGSVYNTGIYSNATSAANNTGIFGGATTATSSPTNNVGVAGYALNAANNVGVLAVYGASLATPISTAFLGDNQANSVPIIVARDNGAALPTTGATATWQVMDGAWPQLGNGVLTSATMTTETQARDSGSLIHSYTWTNAQVAALAGTAGDITVATLPAKTQVRNAYVVITGQAAGPTTVTVSCGDAIGGTPFTNYIVASDAKIAANTVLGDAVAERGTSLDVEFYYLPSYTATTLVTCHFISTGADLSTVTGSTGRVILETSVLP